MTLLYRRAVYARALDPVVEARFGRQEFASWKPQYQAEAVAPIQNKVGQFFSQPDFAGDLGQAHGTAWSFAA